MSQSGALSSSGGGGGGVTSVSGTLNRITSTGGATPVIDIAATYVGQTSLTTLGTITTGVWNGTVIGPTFGGTGQSTYTTGDILYASAANTLSKLAVGSDTQVLTLAAGVPTWAAPATSGTVTSVSGTANRITSTGGATPVIDISASYVGQTSITTLGTITTGVWNGTTIAVANGGTGAVTLTNHGVLIGQGTSPIVATAAGTAGQVLQSGGAAADPLYSTATYPSTATGTGTILRADGTNWAATTATYPNTAATGDLLYGSATNVVSALTVGGINTRLIPNGTTPAWLGRNAVQEIYSDFVSTVATPFANAQSGGATSFTNNTNVDGSHPGVATFATGTTGTGTARIQLYEKSVVLGGGALWWEAEMNLSALSDGTDTYTLYMGLSDNVAGANPANGVFFRYIHSANSGNWVGIARAASSETPTNTSTAVVATTWIKLSIGINAAATLVTFYVNGVSVGTVNATIPTLPIGSTCTITASAGTRNTICYLDYVQQVIVLTTPR